MVRRGRGPGAYLVAWLSVVASLLLSRASSGVSLPAIRYEAPAPCPGEQAFREQVEARTSRLGATADGRTFSVRVVAENGEFVGRFEAITAPQVIAQDVRSERCAEVVAALALITALAVDPEASTSELPPARPVVSEAPRGLPVPVDAARDQESERRAWRWSAGGRALALGAVGPGASFGGGGFVDLANEPSGVLAPSFRLSVDVVVDSTAIDGGGRADFRWVGVRGGGCPLRLPVGRGLDVAPCLDLGVGTSRASGQGLSHSRQGSHVWVDLEAGGRLRGAWLAPVFLELQAGAVRPLLGARTVVDTPPRVVHSVPALGGMGAVAVGVRF